MHHTRLAVHPPAQCALAAAASPTAAPPPDRSARRRVRPSPPPARRTHVSAPVAPATHHTNRNHYYRAAADRSARHAHDTLRGPRQPPWFVARGVRLTRSAAWAFGWREEVTCEATRADMGRCSGL